MKARERRGGRSERIRKHRQRDREVKTNYFCVLFSTSVSQLAAEPSGAFKSPHSDKNHWFLNSCVLFFSHYKLVQFQYI